MPKPSKSKREKCDDEIFRQIEICNIQVKSEAIEIDSTTNLDADDPLLHPNYKILSQRTEMKEEPFEHPQVEQIENNVTADPLVDFKVDFSSRNEKSYSDVHKMAYLNSNSARNKRTRLRSKLSRKTNNAKRICKLRSQETPEEKEARRRRNHIALLKRRLKIQLLATEEDIKAWKEHEARLAAQKRKKRRSREKPQEAEERKRLHAFKKCKQREIFLAVETPDETAARLAAQRARSKKFYLKTKANETTIQREERLERQRIYREKRKLATQPSSDGLNFGTAC